MPSLDLIDVLTLLMGIALFLFYEIAIRVPRHWKK